ncbi:hypothetical protein KKF34_05630 [Myxococcota bacterium]|nr:hypothetical protein [Myxococcota bacterium]
MIKITILLIVSIFVVGCDEEKKENVDCNAITVMADCDPDACDIREARYYTEEDDHAVCEETTFEVCVPKPTIIDESSPEACEAFGNFCKKDANNRNIVIESVFGSIRIQSKNEFIKIEGWELCNCNYGEVDDKKFAAINPGYISICDYCGDGIGNGQWGGVSEKCDGNYFYDGHGSYAYYENGWPCEGGVITCNADCTLNFSNCTSE